MVFQLYIIGVCAVLAWGIFNIIKVTNDYKQEVKLINAIYEYTSSKKIDFNTITSAELLEDMLATTKMYDSIGYYKSRWYKPFDWGYENMVPPEVLEKIRPYISKK